MNFLVDRSAPFVHAPVSVQKTMVTVLAALVPATLFDLWLFGWPALFLFLTTIAACMGAEAICLKVAGKPMQPALSDGSAALTGWLLAMSLPPWAPWWIAVLGAIFAIVLAKHIFGGLGQNVFNPAMVARVALLVSFPVQMTLFVAPQSIGFTDALSITFGTGALDSMSSASALGFVKSELSRGIQVVESLKQTPGVADLLFGFKQGSMGETSAFLILLGGLFLIWRGIISWHIPVTVMGTIFLIGTIFNGVDPARFAPGTFHLFTGATFLGAFFIATDYVTSPVSKQGQLVFGFGVGLLTWVIRTFAGYPEGMAFAVLLMNSLAPIIDQHFRPRVFGRTRNGEPLPVKGDK
jgi:electron transport complex protein RnfD